VRYFEPIGKALQAAGIRHPNLANPAHAWALRGPLWNYAKWYVSRRLWAGGRCDLSALPRPLREHAQFAADFLGRQALEISSVMSKHHLKLADRQCRISEVSRRVQDATIILCTALYAARRDEVVQQAADVSCRELTRGLTGRLASDSDYRAVNRLGETIAEGGFSALAGVPAVEILMPYEND
jgi:hypothetical protein